MTTEQQFTTAMERVVADRGHGWKYPVAYQAPPGFYHNNTPTYSDDGGNPTCLIGAVLKELGLRVPPKWEVASCLSVLGGYVPLKVAIAARCAQVHQDKCFSWGEALDVYRAALMIQRHREYTMFSSMDLYREAVRVALGHLPVPPPRNVKTTVASTGTFVEELVNAFNGIGEISMGTSGIVTTFASGGIVQPIHFTGAEVTFAFSGIPSSLYVSAFAGQPILYQKDHALIA